MCAPAGDAHDALGRDDAADDGARRPVPLLPNPIECRILSARLHYSMSC